MKVTLLVGMSMFFAVAAVAQHAFTKADTLRGMLTPARTCYDVVHYELDLRIDPVQQTVVGFNRIAYHVVQPFDSLQIDLFANLVIDSIRQGNVTLRFRRNHNAVFVTFPETQTVKDSNYIQVFYHGRPLPAKRAPWDGGFVWQRDGSGKPWLGTACQGTGASSWWPCKDHQSDEPETMTMRFTAPSELTCASNGRLGGTTINNDGTTTWTWNVSYPINNYNVTLNLADYAHFRDFFIGINGDSLSLDYYVLKYNERQAREHFRQVQTMLACFEKKFGPYPFYRDGFKLIETSYWGMEHQSAIAYGNAFQNNQYGFDFIIIHESGHEWFGNLLSCADNADMWLHESFTTYAEAVYVECQYDYATGVKYMVDMRYNIADNNPIIGPYNVNFQGTGNDNDMYYKGAWMLHSFRSQLANDSLFFSILRGLLSEFGYVTTNSDAVLSYLTQRAGSQYNTFFDQYLRYPDPPYLLMKKKKKKGGTEITARWHTNVSEFIMNVELSNRDKTAGVTSVKVSSSASTKAFVPNVKPKDLVILNDRYYFKM